MWCIVFILRFRGPGELLVSPKRIVFDRSCIFRVLKWTSWRIWWWVQRIWRLLNFHAAMIYFRSRSSILWFGVHDIVLAVREIWKERKIRSNFWPTLSLYIDIPLDNVTSQKISHLWKCDNAARYGPYIFVFSYQWRFKQLSPAVLNKSTPAPSFVGILAVHIRDLQGSAWQFDVKTSQNTTRFGASAITSLCRPIPIKVCRELHQSSCIHPLYHKPLHVIEAGRPALGFVDWKWKRRHRMLFTAANFGKHTPYGLVA